MTMDYYSDRDDHNHNHSNNNNNNNNNHIVDVSDSAPLLGDRLIRNGINSYDHESSFDRSSLHTEDAESYKCRWRSLRVMYFTQFLAALTFTITMSSVWPFLKVLTPSATTSFLGWVVASYSLGQLFASPLFGAWSNYRKSSKEPLIVTLVIGVFASTFYMYLQSLPNNRNYFMIIARGLVGVSAGNAAVVRSYIASATTLKERTGCMTNNSIAQVLGFIMGPVIQAAVVPFSFPGPVEEDQFHFNMYTATGLISALLTLANLIMVLFIFKEHHISDDGGVGSQRNLQEDDETPDRSITNAAYTRPTEPKDIKPDYVAVFSTIYLFFVTLFMFTILETIATPVTMHMYAWSKSQATFYQGFILGGGGVVSLIVFVAVKPLVTRFSERSLLFSGFVFCLCGYITFLSWGDKMPPRAMATIKNDSEPASTAIYNGIKGNIPQLNIISPKGDFLMNSRQDMAYKTHSKNENSKSNPDGLPGLKFSSEKKLPIQPRSTSTETKDASPYNNFNMITDVQSHSSSSIDRSIQQNNTFNTHQGFHSSTTDDDLSPMTTTEYHSSTTDGDASPTTTTEYHSSTTDGDLSPTTTTEYHSSTTDGDASPTTTTENHRSTTDGDVSHTTTTENHRSTTDGDSSPTTTTENHRSTTDGDLSHTTTTENHRSTTDGDVSHTTTTEYHSSTTDDHHTTKAPHHKANTTVTPEGCPWDYDWCSYTPVIYLPQYLCASTLVSIGYPLCQVFVYIIFSKVLGPTPQGVWMGWLTASGSLARTLGPIYISNIYGAYGPRVTYGSAGVLVLITIVFMLVVYRRLVPYSPNRQANAPLKFGRNDTKPLG